MVAPLRKNQADYQQVFVDLVANGPNCILVSIDRETAILAARLRARYNLTLTDAFQVAAALETNCDALLTNDMIFKRVIELKILVLSEIDV